jgi:histidine ammonia-lyase
MIEITGFDVTIDSVWKVAHHKVAVTLSKEARARVKESRDYIEKKLKEDKPIYGVNTGFGAFSSTRIKSEDLVQLQKNLVRSHSVGVGDPFTIPETRAIMYLRANALATGFSGVRELVIDKIIEYLNNNVIPVIPQQGSVGASGDLAPLSHLALALIGEGEVWKDGLVVPVERVLFEKNITPLELGPKEGLSLMNGCQVMTAVGLLNAYEARRLNWMVDIAGAMSLEALRGSRNAFDPLIPATRPHPGEAKTARNLLKVLGAKSSISESHTNCHRVQDAYSLRCMPAVHGAAKDALNRGIETLEIEANSSTDNPLVFAKDGKILSCGNFHGEPVAFNLDFMCIAISAMASISECRIEKLINPALSELPAFLAPDGGLNSGMMIVQVAAASLVSENKILSHPASVDSIPTSADKEDHVSMGTIAARKFGQIVKNSENVVAMELLCAAQGLDLLKPNTPDHGVLAAFNVIRTQVPFAKQDRVFSKDIEKIKNLIRSEEILNQVIDKVGKLEI